jgi:uncharacterized tellurite resistance protein B-like protein
MNKAIAGYHILSILSIVDDEVDPSEGLVIVDYLKLNFPPFHINLDNEIEKLSTLKKEEYLSHFYNCLDAFYSDSNEKERIDFLKFAIKLIKADNKITKDENKYINEIIDHWDLDQNI